MNQIILWIAAALSIVYGALTAFAGFGQVKPHKIQTWAAWGMVLCGLTVIAAGVLSLMTPAIALWMLIAGLVGIHVLAINNGFKLFGKINPSHHIVRLLVSVVLVALTYLGVK